MPETNDVARLVAALNEILDLTAAHSDEPMTDYPVIARIARAALIETETPTCSDFEERYQPFGEAHFDER
jgi:hypothetical protein